MFLYIYELIKLHINYINDKNKLKTLRIKLHINT